MSKRTTDQFLDIISRLMVESPVDPQLTIKLDGIMERLAQIDSALLTIQSSLVYVEDTLSEMKEANDL